LVRRFLFLRGKKLTSTSSPVEPGELTSAIKASPVEE
jgi:hypothetical protein